MSKNKNQDTAELPTRDNRKISVNVQLEVMGKRPLSVRLFKLFIYLIFAIFSALLTSSNWVVNQGYNSSNADLNNMGIWWIIWLGVIGAASMAVMLFVGRSLRMIWPVKYHIAILFFVSSLLVSILVATFAYRVESAAIDDSIVTRTTLFMVIGIVNGVIQFAILIYFMIISKQIFPQTFHSSLLALPWVAIFPVYGVILREYGISVAEQNQTQQSAYTIILIVLAVLTVIYFTIVIVYSNLFKNNVISNLTNRELEVIERNKEAYTFEILNIAAIMFVQPIVLATNSTSFSLSLTNSNNPAFIIVGALLSTILVGLYIWHTRSRRNKLKNSKDNLVSLSPDGSINKTKNALENSLLFSVYLFLILVVNMILMGFANIVGPDHTSAIYLTTITGVGFLIMTVYNQITDLKTPNIKNYTALTVLSILFGLALLLGILFSTIDDASIIRTFLSLNVSLWLAIIVTIGIFLILLVNIFVTFLAVTGGRVKLFKSKKESKTQEVEKLSLKESDKIAVAQTTEMKG
ncbi:hypothetical protein CJJ23_01350 [Mycoplasmopsis agassizii]|uniref:Uncharacterized protein n=1 Tax=Mycoplasmopsis agassizii TaxID=33922 RepID=A0A269TJD2_9BACT|nr:hypothetical protein [Mycoplasmopsis agassizii]PAK21579.1 hypothetical protein CJJ23_01350 [Mycoplasmopsis agassizii]